MNRHNEPLQPVRYKADAALEAAKEREMARLMRRHAEREMQTAKRVSDAFEVQMFEELPAMNDQGQALLF